MLSFGVGYQVNRVEMRKLRYKVTVLQYRVDGSQSWVEQAEKVSKLTGAPLYQVLTGKKEK